MRSTVSDRSHLTRGYTIALGAAAVLSTTAIFIRHLTQTYGLPALVLAFWRDGLVCLTLLPVSGVPLPFISYGGSNLMTNLMAIGLVLNISRHQQSQRQWAPTEELVRL